MNVNHIPFIDEREPYTGYPMAADAPTECLNGEKLPCDCRDFWVIYPGSSSGQFIATRCDAHCETPISDCTLRSESLRDVLLYAGLRKCGYAWWKVGDSEDCWASRAYTHLDASDYEITPESQELYWSWKGQSAPIGAVLDRGPEEPEDERGRR